MESEGEKLFTVCMFGAVCIAGSFVTKTALGINIPPFLSEILFVMGILMVIGAGSYLGCKPFFQKVVS